MKRVDVRLLGRSDASDFQFTLEVPGLVLPHREDTKRAAGGQELDKAALQAWIEQQPRCTGNAAGTVEGDPLNLVIVGDRASIQECLGTWDESESITLGTSWKTAKAFLLESQYRYSPVSPLYLVDGSRNSRCNAPARASTSACICACGRRAIRFGGQPVWIGQVSRDIGVRFTPKTWNLTTHQIDPNVDEARDYVLDNLLASAASPNSASSRECSPHRRGAPAQSDRRSILHRRHASVRSPIAHPHSPGASISDLRPPLRLETVCIPAQSAWIVRGASVVGVGAACGCSDVCRG